MKSEHPQITPITQIYWEGEQFVQPGRCVLGQLLNLIERPISVSA
jgi:hypothetical protein